MGAKGSPNVSTGHRDNRANSTPTSSGLKMVCRNNTTPPRENVPSTPQKSYPSPSTQRENMANSTPTTGGLRMICPPPQRENSSPPGQNGSHTPCENGPLNTRTSRENGPKLGPSHESGSPKVDRTPQRKLGRAEDHSGSGFSLEGGRTPTPPRTRTPELSAEEDHLPRKSKSASPHPPPKHSQSQPVLGNPLTAACPARNKSASGLPTSPSPERKPSGRLSVQ